MSYQTTNNLTSADLTSLLNTAQTQGATAESSLAVLAGLSPSVDCNNTSVASDVAKFKAAVDKTRSDLNAYKTAVKAFVQALEKLKPDTTSGATQ